MKAPPFTAKATRHFLLILLFLSAALHAAPPKEALLIANGKYSHFAGLAHPSPDAAKLSAALEQLGFRMRVVRDGNREEMLEAISEFERGLRNTGAIAFFHYGGHGVQVDGKNYLLPADSDIPDERRVATRAVALDEVMTAMDAAAARASIIVIDACRDNPLPAGSGRNLARGLSVVGLKPKNSIVIYAAEAGSKALDGLFTPILATALQQKGRTIDQVMKSVRSEVYAKSNGQQTPGEYNQLFEELFLGEPAGANESPEALLAVKPAPTQSELTPIAITVDDMVLVDAADSSGLPRQSFYIGRTEVTWSEWQRVRNWASRHGYDIGNAGKGAGEYHPVHSLNWYDCLKWCNAKSEMTGLKPVYEANGKVFRSGEFGEEGRSKVSQIVDANGYRLPTEEEWEWAARGGKKSRGYKFCGSNDPEAIGWHSNNSNGLTHAVGMKKENELGLHDMSGNVLERCFDSSDSGVCLSRGGNIISKAADYYKQDTDCYIDFLADRTENFGLRLTRSISKKADLVQVEGGTLPDHSELVLVQGGTLSDHSDLAGKTVKSFFIGRTEVTWLEWKKVRNWAAVNGYDIGNIGAGSGDDHPVRDVNWYDCVKWCNARSEMLGLEPVYQVKGKVYRSGEYGHEGSSVVTQRASANGYRLPTEVEWEWAARGGVNSRGYKYSGSDEINAVGWYCANSKGAAMDLGSEFVKKNPERYKLFPDEHKPMEIGCGTFPVAQKERNELNLHDMSGNVWEWCWDLDGVERRCRGGCWLYTADFCTVSIRILSTTDSRFPYSGLRLARSL